MPEKYQTLKKLSTVLEKVSPILVKPTKSSITLSISKRFLLFDLMQNVIKRIEDDPYLNFISLLKHYKVLGYFLHGPIHDLYRDRNKSYFKNFFLSKELYSLIKADIEWVYKKNKTVKLTITKRGVIIYDNYKPKSFNTLLLTIHSGVWMPKDLEAKHALSKKQRYVEEDIDIHKIYSPLVLKGSGIWIDSKLSRFACDYNRVEDRAIYQDGSETWIEKVWQSPLTKQQKSRLMEGYKEFYFTLSNLVEAYRFNIIFDGHSMRHKPGRPDLSFGTRYVPNFYMPIVKTMQKKLKTKGYKKTELNKPYAGGHILRFLKQAYPNIFICSMEINKKLYMSKDDTKSLGIQVRKLSKTLEDLFNI